MILDNASSLLDFEQLSLTLQPVTPIGQLPDEEFLFVLIKLMCLILLLNRKTRLLQSLLFYTRILLGYKLTIFLKGLFFRLGLCELGVFRLIVMLN